MSITNSAVKAAFVVAAGLSVGCQTTTDPYTGEKKTTSTTLGAGSRTDRNDFRNRIDAGGRRRAHCGDDAEWNKTCAFIFFNRRGERLYVHTKVLVCGNFA